MDKKKELCKIAAQILNVANECGKDVFEWIPVSERLPEMSGYYLVTKYKENANIPVLVDCNFYFDSEWCCTGDVMAWRPLPAPYTEGEVDS